MLAALLESFLLGFAITALPGAVFFETIRRTLINKASIHRFLLGSFSGTFLIIVSVFLGLASIIGNKSLTKLFYALSASVLIYIGLVSVVNKSIDSKYSKRKKKGRSSSKAFITGFILGSANPISILFWISTIGKLLQNGGSIGFAALNSLFIILGAVSVYVVLVPLVNYSQKVFKVKNLLILSRSFGLIILFYGCFTLAKII